MVPTVYALRGERYKYVHPYGVWDLDELYDLREDPRETTNLIERAESKPVVERMNRRLFEALAATGGMSVPLEPDRGGRQNQRRRGGPPAADFPASFYRE